MKIRRLIPALLGLCIAVQLALAPLAQAISLGGDFGVKDEIELGEKFRQYILAHMALVEDPLVTSYVRGLVEKLKQEIPAQPFPIQTSVLLNQTLNAFAAPGGYLYVHTGLLLQMEHEAEVAGVLAHELGHVTQRHIAQRIEQMQKISLVSLLGALAGMLLSKGDADVGNAVLMGSMAASQQAMLQYSRDDEREADQAGMNYLTRAGFPASGMLGAFQKIQKLQWLTGSGAPEYLSTHPGISERIQSMEQLIKRRQSEGLEPTNDDSRFLKVRTLVRARLTDPSIALAWYENIHDRTCLDKLGLAIVLSRLNRVNDAQAAFDEAMRCAPDDALFAREAGRFQFNVGRFDQAAANLQRAVFLDPDDLMALFFYARLLGEKGQFEEALKYYKRLIKELPEDSEIRYYTGRLLGEHGRLFEAHLQLAYAALYRNDRKETNFHKKKAEELVKTMEEESMLATFEEDLEKRSEFW